MKPDWFDKLVSDAKDLPMLDIPAFYQRAYCLYAAGQYKEAQELFQLLCSRYPLEGSFWSGLGATCQEMSDYSEAMKAWAMNALLEPTDPMPHFHAAQCAYSLGQEAEATLALMEAKALCKEGDPLLDPIATLEERWIL